MADHLMAAAAVVTDAPVERLQGKAALRGASHKRVEAATMPVDLDDVPSLYAFEPHASSQSRTPLGWQWGGVAFRRDDGGTSRTPLG